MFQSYQISNRVLICLIFLLSLLKTAVVSATETDQQIPSQSVLWKISGKGLAKPSYVFGSWHLLCRNEIIFKHKVKLAISQTEQLLFQNYITYLGPEDYYDVLSENAKINKGKPIYQIKDSKKRKKLLKLIKNKMDLKVNHAKRIMPVVKRMTPMEVFHSSMHSFINDCSRLGSFDSMLFDHFQKNSAPIGSFNDRKQLLESFMKSRFVDVDSLISYLENLESQQALVKEMKKHYYLNEDMQGLKDLYRIFLTNDFVEANQVNENILNLNTVSWVNVMIEWMSNQPTFISVNANYLVGDNKTNVLEILKSKGYQVEPVFD